MPTELVPTDPSPDRDALLALWARCLPDQPERGRALLERYAEPQRRYHDLRHLARVLFWVDELADDHDLFLVRLAAFYHDAVYALPPGQVTNEEASARLALKELSRAGLEQEDLNEVARLVRLTATHAPGPRDPDGELLCDADLAVLAGTAEEYADYVADVTAEYAYLPRAVFAAGRYEVLTRLSERDLFSTAKGRRLESRASANLAAERQALAEELGLDEEGGERVTHGARAAEVAPDRRPDGWWRSAVVYQIYPRSFADSNGDGMGDLPGITERLDYLASLGVDVVWLSPVYRSPQDDNGYDISDYHDVDPLFGTLEELDQLIEELHARGLKLVMDLVVNHTSDEHPWFVESRDPASPKRDWYFWRPPRAGSEPGSEGAEPTNWGSAFSGSAWAYDERSGEYYLHMFTRKQPDLNWENPEVRQAIYAMMRWWVDRGVDGFRMDVINLISKPSRFTDGDPPPGQRYFPSFIPIANGPRLDEFLAEMNREVGLDARNLLTVGEMPGSSIATARAATDPERSELNMVFTFEHVNLDQVPGGAKWDLAELPLPVLKANLAAWQDGLAEAGWNSLYWDNHDQPRAVSRFGDDRPEHRVASAKTLATVLHLHRGTPYVYQGEELGMTNTYFSDIGQYADVESINYHADALSLGMEAEAVLLSLGRKSRDNARTPMHWDDTMHAGFSSGIPWLPVNPNYVTINAAAAVADPDSVFHHYRRLVELRHTDPLVVDGTFQLLLPDDPQLWAFTRTLGDRSLLVLANCSSEVATWPESGLPDLAGAELLLTTHREAGPAPLRPWESRLYRLR